MSRPCVVAIIPFDQIIVDAEPAEKPAEVAGTPRTFAVDLKIRGSKAMSSEDGSEAARCSRRVQ